MLKRTGLSRFEHQKLTVHRYDALLREQLPFHIMPVLQGYAPEDYAAHVRMYGPQRLADGMWTGVGSVCKRNADPASVVAVLAAVKAERPDLRLHGFGLKQTALRDGRVRALLHSADRCVVVRGPLRGQEPKFVARGAQFHNPIGDLHGHEDASEK